MTVSGRSPHELDSNDLMNARPKTESEPDAAATGSVPQGACFCALDVARWLVVRVFIPEKKDPEVARIVVELR